MDFETIFLVRRRVLLLFLYNIEDVNLVKCRLLLRCINDENIFNDLLYSQKFITPTLIISHFNPPSTVYFF